ncbi:MAG: Hsp20/alpha crystallin family protein [Planctomycetes bacterium]|nr:Hsp20/alpha crystallin family protein [Planctomycetota bacterium]
MTGYFERVIPIDIPIDAANIQARYEAGFLEIAIPKGQQKAATTLVITIINR